MTRLVEFLLLLEIRREHHPTPLERPASLTSLSSLLCLSVRQTKKPSSNDRKWSPWLSFKGPRKTSRACFSTRSWPTWLLFVRAVNSIGACWESSPLLSRPFPVWCIHPLCGTLDTITRANHYTGRRQGEARPERVPCAGGYRRPRAFGRPREAGPDASWSWLFNLESWDATKVQLFNPKSDY